MSEPRHAARVGVFVVLTLILTGTLLLVFSKGLGWFTPSYTLRLRAENVGGLKARSAVLVSGVAVGRVTDTELSPDGKGVTIFLQVEKRYGIHRDARFVVEQVGLLGDQFVVVYPTENKGPLLQDNDEVDCAAPFNLQEVARSTVGFIQRIDQTARVLNEAIVRVNTMLLSEGTLTNLAAGIGNFRQMSERANRLVDRLDELVVSNSPPVSSSVTNLLQFSEELNRVATEVRQAVAENRGSLTGAVKSLEETSGTLSRLVRDLEAGKGAVGSLLRDEQVQLNLSNTLTHLASAASNVANYGLLFKPRKPPKSGK